MNEEAYNKTMEPLIHNGNTPIVLNMISPGINPKKVSLSREAMQKRCACVRCHEPSGWSFHMYDEDASFTAFTDYVAADDRLYTPKKTMSKM